MVDAVDVVVDVVHDRAIRPVYVIARGLVFGLVIVALGATLVTLLSVALIRLLDVYAFGSRVWASYLLVGGVFTLIGLAGWVWGSRRASSGAEGR